VASGLSPYRYNSVRIDPKGTSMDVEVQNTDQQVAPRAGAVVAIRYQTITGRAAVITVVREDGQSVPFGAQVLDSGGNPVGVVGQASRAFVRGVPGAGALHVQWGEQVADRCELNYDVEASTGQAILPRVQAVCHMKNLAES